MQFKKGRERLTDIVAEKLKLLPDSPGVYIMKDASGRIIYVGKAVVLKNRVRQYFQHNKNHSPKVKAMVSHIADFEIIMTHSEVEALILECNLIKKHRPHYNISLKDDKSYPYVKVTVQEEYPRVFLTHRVTKDGARYFGPYTDVTAVHQSLKLLRRLFPLRTCRHLQDRPCLEYHIKRCLAPCVGKVTKEDYAAMIRAVLLFLEGRTEDVERELKFRMEQAAAAFHFETAARLRDQLRAVQKIAEKQNIVTGAGDQDAIGIARSEIGVCVQVFFIRAGKMIGREHFLLQGSEEESDADILAAFLSQYYHRAAFVPREVLLPLAIAEEERALLESWLTEKKHGIKVQLLVPQRGTKRDIVAMAEGNAEKYLADEAARIKQADEKTMGAVRELGRYLGLKKMPYRMECFDISHIQGSETVARWSSSRAAFPRSRTTAASRSRAPRASPTTSFRCGRSRRAAMSDCPKKNCRTSSSSTAARDSSLRHSRSSAARAAIRMCLSSASPSSSSSSSRRARANLSSCRATARRSTSSSASATRRTASPSPITASCAASAISSPSSTTSSASAPKGARRCAATLARLRASARRALRNCSKRRA